jgi:hypothetical protein
LARIVPATNETNMSLEPTRKGKSEAVKRSLLTANGDEDAEEERPTKRKGKAARRSLLITTGGEGDEVLTSSGETQGQSW